MSNLRNSRGGRPIPGAFNAEFTPGQMVVGICIFLFAMIASFGAGILVARMDPSFQKTAEVIDLTQPGQPTLPNAPKPEKPATPPASTPAATPSAPAAPAAPAAQAPVPPLPPAPKEDPNAPRRVELPAPAAPKSSNKPVEVPVSMPAPVVSEGAKPGDTPATAAAPAEAAKPESPKPESPKTETSPAKTDAKADTKTAAAPVAADLPPLPATTKTGKTETPAETATKTDVAKVDPKKAGVTPTDPKKGAAPVDADLEDDLLEPIATTPKTAATKTGVAKTPAATEKPAAAAPTGGGTFGIQVGAFPGANREAQAAELKKRVDAAGLSAEVRPSKDKQYYRVLVVGYKDRAAAIKALSDLKARPGFEKAFVQDLSKL